jgi:SAM-dependent methyltransferase
MTTATLPSPAASGKLVRSKHGPATWGQTDMSAAVLAHYDPRTTKQSGDRPFRMLEAGGGSSSWVPLPPGAEITTVDISQEQLDRNHYASEKLLGDLETFDYGARRFDLVVCWDVLEHLERPDAAIDRLVSVLQPGGRLIVKGPLPWSLKGFVTRFSPHWVHVAHYRHILGLKTAGQPGYAPFKAYLEPGSDPHVMAAVFASKGLVVDAIEGYESDQVAAIAAKSRLLLGCYRFAEAGLSALSFGRYSAGMTDFFLIVRRPTL